VHDFSLISSLLWPFGLSESLLLRTQDLVLPASPSAVVFKLRDKATDAELHAVPRSSVTVTSRYTLQFTLPKANFAPRTGVRLRYLALSLSRSRHDPPPRHLLRSRAARATCLQITALRP
jgi:hypothetical protein